MKNKKIIDSWKKIEPSASDEERMLEKILARNASGRGERNKVFGMNKVKRLLVPVAACLAVIIVLAAVLGGSGRVYTAELGGGTLSFSKGVLGDYSMDLDIDASSRALTAQENDMLFGGIISEAYGLLSKETGELLHVEGKSGDTKVIFAAEGVPVTDVVLEGNEKTSTIGGVPVSAGYCITDENSKGIRNIIYFASFKLGSVSVHAVLGGEQSKSDELRGEIAGVIDRVIENGSPDFSKITA